MKLLAYILLFSISMNVASECKWSDTVSQGDKFVYSRDCHILVGKLLKEADLREEQVKKLNEALKLSDLAVTKADERAVVWRETSYSLEERVRRQNQYSTINNAAWFGGGILTTVLAAWAVGQASK